ncbi:MAG: amidohydrolase family protein [Verrucomicrobiota bacterium]|nr:amidohydrolase family protein [Verrucomicrobiota bacterium]
MLLRARIVLPVSKPPIVDGVVRVEHGRVVEVGKWGDLCGEAEDLGDVLLMPGLINAHCHLDYTNLAGRIPAPETFDEWISGITRHKKRMGDGVWRESWLKGARQCLQRGTTTVGNIETRPDLLATLWPKTPLRLLSFLEIIVVRPESDSGTVVQETANWLQNNEPPRGAVGLSPHAPYTVKPDALLQCAEASKKHGWGMSMHLAESADESAMFLDGVGPLFKRLANVGRDMSDCGDHSPMEHASRHGLLDDRLLAVHANYIDDNDIGLLAQNGVSVAHCPRSHDYFGHAPFRFWELRAAGVNVCLGTDSLATVEGADAKLDMFAEMRIFQGKYPDVSPEVITSMATVNGAKALGWAGEVGEISTGACADLLAFPYSGSADGVYGAVVEHSGPVAVMVDGQWEIRPTSLLDHHGD